MYIKKIKKINQINKQHMNYVKNTSSARIRTQQAFSFHN